MTNQELRKELKEILWKNFEKYVDLYDEKERTRYDRHEADAIDDLAALFIRQHRQMIPEEKITTPPTVYDAYNVGFNDCRQQMLDKLEGEYE